MFVALNLPYSQANNELSASDGPFSATHTKDDSKLPMDQDFERLDEIYSDQGNFVLRARQELQRAQRYLNFISFLKIDASRLAKNGEIEDDGPNSEIYRKLKLHLRESLRQTDVLSGFKEGIICVLLIETDKSGAQEVKKRLNENIRYFLHQLVQSPLNWRVDINSGSYPDDKATPNSFLDSLNLAFNN